MTPKGLDSKPVHRWYVFPHSFTDEIVGDLANEWGLKPESRVLDPFVGSGTTLVACRSLGLQGFGCDLSPLAVLASAVKSRTYEYGPLEAGVREFVAMASAAATGSVRHWSFASIVQKAVSAEVREVVQNLLTLARSMKDERVRAFCALAILNKVPEFSAAVRSGGWLRLCEREVDGSEIPPAVSAWLEEMLSDVRISELSGASGSVVTADARKLPFENKRFDAIITSPPYPNRHDYTRVFGIELSLAFLEAQELIELRHRTLCSHPEALPQDRPDGYSSPQGLMEQVEEVKISGADRRVVRMLNAYFEDMYRVLVEAKRVCKSGARMAFIVGNVQYAGVTIPVDEHLAEIGRTIGLNCTNIYAARWRGNSAQQMKTLGRRPSRESAVIFQNL